MANIFLSPKAEMDLEQIGDYIARQSGNFKTALNTITKIKNRIDELEVFPLIGKPLSAVVAVDTAYRFLGCGNYLAFYRYEHNHVFIDRILHSKQNYILILLGDINDEHDDF